MEHLAETFHVIFGDVDFTVTDRHVALVLATALQQNRRHDRIKECLLEGADPLVRPPLHLYPSLFLGCGFWDLKLLLLCKGLFPISKQCVRYMSLC